MLVDAVGKHVVLNTNANLATLDIHDWGSVARILNKGRVATPRNHDIATLKLLQPAHGARIDALWMKVLVDHTGRHVGDVNLEMQATAYTLALAVPAAPDVVVKQGNVALVVVEAGVVLPAEVGGCPVTQVSELVSLTAKDPDWMPISAADESDER